MTPAAVPAPRTDETGAAPIPELDGVRGIAILLVMLFHFQGVRPPGIPKFLTYPMILGWSGVDLFFVLSGFLITRILISTRGAPNYFSAFYARRILRIFPLYFVAVFLFFRVALPLAARFGWDLGTDPGLEPWFWFHLSNGPSAFGRDARPLSHFWSLSIEEQFYLAWPAVVRAVAPRWLGAVCAGVAALAVGLRVAAAAKGVNPEALHRLTVFRMDALALGGLVAWIAVDPARRAALRRRLRVVWGASAVLLAALCVAGRGAVSPVMTRFGYTAVALFDAGFVFVAFDRSGSAARLSRILRQPWLRAFGKYSYAMYVFHYPVALVAERLAPGEGASALVRTIDWLASVIGGIAVSFLLALASWNLLEKRFLVLKNRFVARPVAAPAA
ncbi:MAG TPA: acyltransferase [Thermoanaerobaculia bacterium]|nr:acyltransferase [Thermoanaerobaculia bacterium]